VELVLVAQTGVAASEEKKSGAVVRGGDFKMTAATYATDGEAVVEDMTPLKNWGRFPRELQCVFESSRGRCDVVLVVGSLILVLCYVFYQLGNPE